MKYIHLVYLHLSTILPAILIGSYLMAFRKGTPLHKFLGKIYMTLMLLTAVISVFLPAHVGPSFLNHFGYIHLLSALTIYSVPTAYFAARRGDIKTHKRSMIALYCGGILLAGSFALVPGRLLHDWLFG